MMRAHLIAGLLMLAFTADPTGAAERVKVGVLGTTSGPNAQLGIDALAGFRLGIDVRGGKLGGLPVDLVAADDQLKPDQGVQEARRLADRDKVDFVVGTTFSNILMAVIRPLTERGVFVIGPNAGPSPLAGAQCNPNFFAVSYQNDQIYEPMGTYLTGKDVKRVVVLAPNYQAGKDAIAGFRRTFKGEIVGELYTALNQLDYAGELAQIAAARPDAVFAFYPGGLAINFVKQYAQAGLKARLPLYSGFALVDEGVRGAQGEAALGLLTSGNWSPDLPAGRDFVEAFRKAYNRTPSEYAMYAFDAAALLDAAITSVRGDLADKDGLRTALRTARFESARGSFRFNTNHFPKQDWLIREVVAAPGGGTTLVARDVVTRDASDNYVAECQMRW